MKKLYKIIALVLSVIMLTSLISCGKQSAQFGDVTNGGYDFSDMTYTSLEDVKDKLTAQVDYTKSDEQFKFFTYKSLSNGSYSLYGDPKSVGESFVTDEKIKEYFDSGMTYIQPQTVAPANSTQSTPFKDTALGKLLDQCERLGYNNSVVISDNMIYSPYLIARDKYTNAQKLADWTICSTMGEGQQFADEAALDAYIETQLRQYYFHSAFAGIFLPDEPSGFNLKPIGELYRSVRRVEDKLKVEKAAQLGVNVDQIEDMYINANLLPKPTKIGEVNHFGVPDENFKGDATQKAQEAYRIYIERFLEVTGADYVQADIYPMLTAESGIEDQYLTNLQIMAEVAKEHDAKIIVITQTNNDTRHRLSTYESIKYLNNSILAMGALNIGYYGYYTFDDGNGAGGMDYTYDDNGCMMSRFGDKTPVYYAVQQLNIEAQKLAPVILNFDYNTSKTFINYRKKNSSLMHMETLEVFMESTTNVFEYEDFAKLTKVEIDKEATMVSELYDDDKDNYMYVVMNATDPANKGSLYYQSVTLTFAEGVNRVLGCFNGSYEVYELEGSTLTVKMSPGEAHYLIPFTA